MVVKVVSMEIENGVGLFCDDDGYGEDDEDWLVLRCSVAHLALTPFIKVVQVGDAWHLNGWLTRSQAN